MKAIPVLPIGAVSLKNGKNHLHGTVFAAWPDSAFVLVQNGNGTLRGIASYGTVEALQKEFPVGASLEFVHDQTHKNIGHSRFHRVVSHHPITQEGLSQVAALHNVGGLQMATLK